VPEATLTAPEPKSKGLEGGRSQGFSYARYIALRLEPHDEYMHELGPELNFNESMYFNFFDPACRLGGFFRLGNRPNERTGEMTVCLWMPDGRVAFMFRRPDVTDNNKFDAAGLRFEVLEPFRALRISYVGGVLILDDPLEMADPAAAFRSGRMAGCSAELEYSGLSAMFGGEPETAVERPGEEFARGHYEQLVAVTGTATLDGQELEVSGYGLRDHSWGPRYWQAPWYYRWLTGNFGGELGFMGSRIARREGDGVRSGFVWEDGMMHICDDFRISSSWDRVGGHHKELDAQLLAGTRTWNVHGRVLSVVPLRNRRRDASGTELVTRISEGLTEWTLQDGRTGFGLSEYLDQIVDGAPAGAAE
jgi:hypothetical protein